MAQTLTSRSSHGPLTAGHRDSLPRDAMCKRGTSCRAVSVRLSVRHTRVLYRIEMA